MAVGPGQADTLLNPRPIYPILQCTGEEPSSSRTPHNPILHIKPVNQASLHTGEVKAREGGTSIVLAEVPSAIFHASPKQLTYPLAHEEVSPMPLASSHVRARMSLTEHNIEHTHEHHDLLNVNDADDGLPPAGCRHMLATMPKPAPEIAHTELHVERNLDNKPGSKPDLPVWWDCPWCDFAVRGKPKHSNDCTQSRQKAQHIAEQHPEKDPRDPAAINNKPMEEAKAARLAAIKASRIHNLKQFVKTAHGGHKLAYVSGFTIQCARCSYKGTKGSLPARCTLLKRGGHRNCNAAMMPNLIRGGFRLDAGMYGPVEVPGDGMCLFHSISTFVCTDAHTLRDSLCDALALSAGQLTWQGQLHKEWAQQDTGLRWQAYVAAIRKGTVWPGILEIHMLARMYKVILEVYVRDNGSFKRIAKLVPEVTPFQCPIWRLDYQDGQHFEPLISHTQHGGHVPRATSANATPFAPSRANSQCANAAPDRNLGPHTLLLANVSSLTKHGNELYEIAANCNADTSLVTETRLARDTKIAKLNAAQRGFHISCSSPRPQKAGGGGPKEGGVAILNRVAAPDVVAKQCPVALLSADDALHSIIPVGNSLCAHVIVAYCPHPSDELRAALFSYAATLGEVPIIIGADWNVEPFESRALSQAIGSGAWTEPAGMLARAGCNSAAVVAQSPTTHRAGTQGRRIDYFLVNEVARPLISEVFIVAESPLVNHFAVGLRIETPKDLSYKRIQPTTRHLRQHATRAQVNAIAQNWDEFFQAEQTTWNTAQSQGDVDAMWEVWSRVAEAAIGSAIGTQPTHPKGTTPCLETRQICSPKSRCETHRNNLLAKTQLRLNRLRVVQRSRHPCPVELQALGSKIRAAMRDLVELPESFDFADTNALQTLLNQAQHDREMLVKRRRVAAWQERVTSNLSTACKWVRGDSPVLDMLDTPDGPTSHPQRLADELLRRSQEQFESTPDPAKRAQFFAERGGLIHSFPCELPTLDATELRKVNLKKAHAASGVDGWGPHELGALPIAAFQALVDLCTQVEKVGKWPRPLLYGQIVGLPKPGKVKEGHIRVRPICVLPILIRSWSSLRYKHLHGWMEAWIPHELHGGLPSKSTLSATAPILTAVARAGIDEEPFIGVSLDYTACFDRIDINLGVELLKRLGLPNAITQPLLFMYQNMQRTCRVGAACSEFFHAQSGIIQGCSMSVLILNAIMSVWVWWTKREVGDAALQRSKVLLSIYLDDRNIVSACPQILAQILKKSKDFDALINSELNPKKCQIYANTGVDTTAVQALLPGAELSHQVWTLGYNLQVEISEALEALQCRYAKAIATAHRAAALPHDMRAKVLEATFTSQWAYGAFIKPPTPQQAHNLQTCVEHALAGNRRKGWNQALFWTVVYKGHKFIPQFVILLQSISFLHAVLHMRGVYMTADVEHIRQHLVNEAPGAESTVCSPFHVLHHALLQVGGSWRDAHTIALPNEGGVVFFDLLHDDYDAIKHGLREFCRQHTLRTMGRPGWQLPTNIDFAITRSMLRSPQLSFLEKGILRTILMGALRPEIQQAHMGHERIRCSRCHTEADTAGHRFWRCPATHALRNRMLPQGVPDGTHVVLTRFGVVPSGTDKHFARCIQKFLVAAVKATSQRSTSGPPRVV